MLNKAEHFLDGWALPDDATKAPVGDQLTFERRHFASRIMTLWPGDVVATGTPAGVGLGRTPPVYLKRGDIVEIEVEGIGTLVTPIR